MLKMTDDFDKENQLESRFSKSVAATTVGLTPALHN